MHLPYNPLFWWLFCIGTLALLAICVEIGYRVGRSRRTILDPEQKSQVSTVVGALLALVGFLMAISFGIAEGRFGQRKTVVMREANAIGTTYLRADFLSNERERTAVRTLIRDYTQLRLDAAQGSAYLAAIPKSEELQNKIWAIAASAAKDSQRSVPMGLFIDSLNEMIDIHQDRITIVFAFHLPPSLIKILYLVTLFTTVALGFFFGLGGTRNAFITSLLIVSLGSVLLLIVDIDQIQPHFFKVSQRPIADTLKSMASE